MTAKPHQRADRCPRHGTDSDHSKACRRAGLAGVVTVCFTTVFGLATGQAAAQDVDTAPVVPPSFQPSDISIGTPVTLPFNATPANPAAVNAPPVADSPAMPGNGVPVQPRQEPLTATARDPVGSALPSMSRSGWLGLVVAESNVVGRWRVDEVAPGGPADAAGLRAGDELRAVNGVAPRNADEVSQALTAIVADQTVRLAIGRGDDVSDVLLRAAPRPVHRGVASAAPAPSAPSAFAGSVMASPSPTTPQSSTPPSSLPPSVATTTVLPPPDARPPEVTVAPDVSMALPPTVSAPDVSVPAMTVPSVSVPPPLDSRSSAAASVPAPRFGSDLDAPGSFAGTSPGALVASAPAIVFPSSPPPQSTNEHVESRAASAAGRTALGVRTIPIDPFTQERFQLTEPAGAYVIGVVQDLPASRAGVPPGSVIVAIDERPVHSPMELTALVTSSPVNRPVTVRFLLPGGTARQAEVVLQSIDPPLLRALGADDPASAETRIARRPIDDTVSALRREIGVLRESLRQLETRLDAIATGDPPNGVVGR